MRRMMVWKVKRLKQSYLSTNVLGLIFSGIDFAPYKYMFWKILILT